MKILIFILEQQKNITCKVYNGIHKYTKVCKVTRIAYRADMYVVYLKTCFKNVSCQLLLFLSFKQIHMHCPIKTNKNTNINTK